MNPKDFEALLSDTEGRLERLRSQYDQWFQGIERFEPAKARADMERRFRKLRTAQPNNTALRFRFNTLWQRFVTFQNYWNRVARQIEEGTYQRDVNRVRRRRAALQQAREAVADGQEPSLEIDVDLDDFDIESEVESALAALDAPAETPPGPDAARTKDESSPRRSEGSGPPSTDGSPSRRASLSPFSRPSAPPKSAVPVTATFGKPKAAASSKGSVARPGPGQAAPRSAGQSAAERAAAPQPPRAGRGPARSSVEAGKSGNDPRGPRPPANAGRRDDIGEERLKRLYNDYIEARRRNNERTDNVRYETMAKSVRQMVPKLREKHGGKRIDFEVVVKDGRVGIKPKSE